MDGSASRTDGYRTSRGAYRSRFPAPIPRVRAKRKTKISIKATASPLIMRTGQQIVITLVVRNTGASTARSTVARVPIPLGFTVGGHQSGTIRDGDISFALGKIPVKGKRVRTFVHVATRAGVGKTVPVMGRAVGSNVRPVKDPTALSVIASSIRLPPVTG